MEQSASPQLQSNWRFQQALYRAYYDADTRSRLLSETDLEAKAMAKLRDAKKMGSLARCRKQVRFWSAVADRVSSRWPRAYSSWPKPLPQHRCN